MPANLLTGQTVKAAPDYYGRTHYVSVGGGDKRVTIQMRHEDALKGTVAPISPADARVLGAELIHRANAIEAVATKTDPAAHVSTTGRAAVILPGALDVSICRDDDGTPIVLVQTEPGTGRFRIDVNDGAPIWDRDAEDGRMTDDAAIDTIRQLLRDGLGTQERLMQIIERTGREF